MNQDTGAEVGTYFYPLEVLPERPTLLIMKSCGTDCATELDIAKHGLMSGKKSEQACSTGWCRSVERELP